MGYIISIIKDRFSNNEQEIYKTRLEDDANIKILVDLIKQFDDLEQQIEYNEPYELEV